MNLNGKRNHNNNGISLYIKGLGKTPVTKKSFRGLNRSVDVKTAYNFFNVVIRDKHDGITVGHDSFRIKIDLTDGLERLSNFYESLFKIGYLPIRFALYGKNEELLFNDSYLRKYIIKQIKRHKPASVILDITYKYGPVVTDIPEFIYFLTNTDYIPSILEDGIYYDIKHIVRRKSYKMFYLKDNKSYNSLIANTIAKKHKWNVSVLKVKTENIEGFFYEDFDFIGDSLYIHSPVKPEDIVEVKKLYRIHFLKPHKVGRKSLYHNEYIQLSNESQTKIDWGYNFT